MDQFEKVPSDIIRYMALVMDLPELLSLCRTSKRFNREICENVGYWRERLAKDFDTESPNPKRLYEKLSQYDVTQPLDSNLILAITNEDLEAVKYFEKRGVVNYFRGIYMAMRQYDTTITGRQRTIDIIYYLLGLDWGDTDVISWEFPLEFAVLYVKDKVMTKMILSKIKNNYDFWLGVAENLVLDSTGDEEFVQYLRE